MAWIDDRVWCHPKLADITDRSFRVWVNGIAYSSGMETGGVLTPGQQKLIGSSTQARQELVGAGLWDQLDENFVEIHDWSAHNSRRDERKREARERMRKLRAERAANSSQNSSKNGAANRSALKAVKEVTEVKDTASRQLYESLDPGRKRDLDRILSCVQDADEQTANVLAFYAQSMPEGRLAKVRESVENQAGRVGAGWAVNALKDEARATA